jgi:hypothetical protein
VEKVKKLTMMAAIKNENADVGECGARPGVARGRRALIDSQGPLARERLGKDRLGSVYLPKEELEVAESSPGTVREITVHGRLLGLCVSNRISAEVLRGDFFKETRRPHRHLTKAAV